jgi:hypothetical protein
MKTLMLTLPDEVRGYAVISLACPTGTQEGVFDFCRIADLEAKGEASLQIPEIGARLYWRNQRNGSGSIEEMRAQLADIRGMIDRLHRMQEEWKDAGHGQEDGKGEAEASDEGGSSCEDGREG